VFVKRVGAAAMASLPVVDVALALEYRRALASLAQTLSIPDTTTADEVARQPGVLRLEERSTNIEAATAALHEALDLALGALSEMRKTEGESIRADLEGRLKLISTLVREIEELAPKSVEQYRARLETRVAELARGMPVDPSRLAQEVAFFAERSDIAEELTRLGSHLDQFRALIASPEPAGRKMDFLVQEMHREVNTTGSKSQHAEIASRVVALKAELERLREQIQNVE
jgi:uncharacterized protein (TIGR00255 family)